MPFEKLIRFFLVGPFPNGAIGGITMNFLLTITTLVTGFVLGMLLALGRISRFAPLRLICTVIIETIRSIPLLLIAFWFVLVAPLLLGKVVPGFITAYLAIALYSAVNQAEIFRGGIMGIDKGQYQAALCSGLSRIQCMLYVIIPQMFQKVLPSYIGFIISLFKDTSLVTIVGLIDLTYAGVMVSQRYPGDLFLCYGIMAFMYFIVCYILSKLSQKAERRMHAKYGISAL